MKNIYVLILLTITIASLPSLAQAKLRPSEIAIIAVRGSKESERLAEYYAEQRKIPAENICLVVMPKGETLDREKWQWAVRPEIRKWLEDKDPQREIRCLVTTWDVPLKIGRGKKDSPALLDYRDYLTGERSKRVALLKDITKEFEVLAPGVALANSSNGVADASSASSDPADKEAAAKAEQAELEQRLEKALQAAQARIRQLNDPQEQQQALAKVQQYATMVGGVQVLAQSLQSRIQAEGAKPPELNAELERLRGMMLAYLQMRQELEAGAPGIERDHILLNVLSQAAGLIQSIKWLDEQISIADKNETAASFDSELSLVMWPDDYQLLRWQPNYLLPRYNNSQLRETFRTLMVARLDAPTLKLAKGLIDTAIQVEETGLVGKVYLDARGIGKLDQPNVSPGSYADFDRALLITAEGLKEQTTLDVVLDEKPELFQAGDCPDAALYCGWYSLGKYVDAFDWAPGAVAYHLASAEATTLRNKESEVWCKRMLEDGVCATIGPVYEPYLVAFPRPNEFLALLIKGELSLVECYYQTKPFNSWMMTLIGDPLYRPFAKRNVRK
ncbi:TIGR03790 family protein [Bythopirellula polymerisocia]|uniref:TIGR03790 family protein n=1 Tax=Bythopirellula polymerisocia TaxID=2528003 RepID=A0A5C6CST7_9BACT|nr:TIGR03790 family protein [Bythopirellula polymerisocia]TWU25809.1 hypothetical protein Pla144_30210 [Bythopirellula polymerisocia]